MDKSINIINNKIQDLTDTPAINIITRSILENPLVGIILVKNRIITCANKKMAEMFGYSSPDEMIGKPTLIIYRSVEDFENIGKTAYADIKAGKEAKIELSGRRKDGSVFWCLLSGALVESDDSESPDFVWMFQDIDEVMKQKEAIERNRHQAMLDNPLIGILYAKKRRIVEVNNKMAEMFGYSSPDEMIGKPTLIIYRSVEDFENIGKKIYSELSIGREAKVEYLGKRKDGSEFWCFLSGRTIEGGERADVPDSVWMFQDIDEVKKQKEMLESDIYRTILNNSIVGIAMLSERKILQLNDKMAEMFGYSSQEELLGNTTRILYPSLEDYEKAGKMIYVGLSDNTEVRIELKMRRKDGTVFWCLLSGKSLNPGESGGADSVWIYHDIDEVKKQEDKLRESKKLSEAIIRNMPDAILVVGNDKNIMSFNSSFLAMFELKAESISGKKIHDCLNPKLIGMVDEIFYEINIGGIDVYSSEIEISNGKGFGKAMATPIHADPYEAGDSRGISDKKERAFIGIVISIRDITREKEMDNMKSDFISTVSHELRTPLTSILGFASIIQKKFRDFILPNITSEDKKIKKASEQIENNVEIIISEGNRLASLVNGIVDIDDMESLNIEWKDEYFDIKGAIGIAISYTDSMFKEKGLDIRLDIKSGLPEIYADKSRFVQVLTNLLSNAAKFTDDGGVLVEAYQDGDFLTISVKDTGRGINDEDKDKIFDKFKQLGNTLTDKPNGLGLGLPISKHIVEHYGGKIWVESKQGKGADFYFTIMPDSARNAKLTANA